MTRTLRLKDLESAAANDSEQPFFTTGASGRNGSRGTVSGPVADGELFTKAEWRTRLEEDSQQYTTGTTDPSFSFDGLLNYQGAFRIPHRYNQITGQELDGKDCIAFNPPEAGGRNGPNGSLFVGGAPGWVCEVQIPADLKQAEQNHLNLSEAPLLQDWTNMLSKAPTPPADPEHHYIGWLKVDGGKLYMSMYDTYMPSGSNTENLLICNDPTDLANSTCQGMLNLAGADQTVKYIMDVPSELQADFGGSHLSGICATISIIERSSFGHSLVAWSPENIEASDSAVSSTTWTAYDGDSPIGGFSDKNAGVVSFYADILGETLGSYVNSDPDTRLTSLEPLGLPSSSVREHMGTWDTKCGIGFFVPGTNTIAFIGYNSGMRFGNGYKAHTLEYGNTRDEDSGNAPYSINDFDNVMWTFNIDDVLGRTNTHDPQYSSFHMLNDPWGEQWGEGKEGEGGKAMGGAFDPNSNTLFLVHGGFSWSQYSRQWVISVFQVGGDT